MARFFVDELPAEGTQYCLTGENAAHAKVLRLRPGEEVTLCDGRGSDCVCTVADGLTLRAGAPLPCPAEPRARVALYLAFPKADKAEHVIQKAVELGAAEIVLFPSRYCVSRPDDKSLDKKLERWQKIARSAAEQSRRGVIPAVRVADSYANAITEAAKADVPVLFYENEEQYSLHEALAFFPSCHSERPKGLASRRSEESVPPHVGERIATASVRTGLAMTGVEDGTPPHPSPVCTPVTPSPQGEGLCAPAVSLMTGAEGGFSEEEIAQARAVGMKICTLGPRILRCETAPLAGLTAVMYALGEM